MAQIAGWCGRKDGNDMQDDITIIVIDFKCGALQGQICG